MLINRTEKQQQQQQQQQHKLAEVCVQGHLH